MIISQTPYRVSFAGGGTDLPQFYTDEWGAVISVTLDKHMYVTISPRFDPTTRVAYTKTEIARSIDDLEHSIAREALRMTGLGSHLEITTIGDVPAGTGLGSSSSLAVGLLNALYGYKGQIASSAKLAEQACQIEIDILKKPIGRQDQYAAAFGGINYIQFNSDHSVHVEPVPCRPEVITELQNRAIMVYTNQRRSADVILRKQASGITKNRKVLQAMRDLTGEIREALGSRGDLDEFSNLLGEGWKLKRSLGYGISNDFIDLWYETARKAGAQGGKLLGAGSSGFLFLMAPPERHEMIRQALGRPRELRFGIDRRGSRIIFISEQ